MLSPFKDVKLIAFAMSAAVRKLSSDILACIRKNGKKNTAIQKRIAVDTEGVGFEPTWGCPQTVFKTASL